MARTTTQIPAAATRPLYAGVGMTDLVVETVRDYVAEMQRRLDEMQKTVADFEVQPEVDKAGKAVSARIDTLSKDARARRRHVEKRVAELQTGLQALPTRLQKLVDAQVATAGGTYTDLVKRGESLVDRIRRQQSTKDAEAAAKTTVTKAKTTKTQATKSAKKSTAKARKSPAKSSAKATGTSARKTASSSARAVADAAQKVGD